MTQQLPLWVVILVALGIPTLVAAAIGASFKAWQAYQTWKRDGLTRSDQRADQREDREEQREDRREESDAAWNRRARANIERHIPWDAKVAAHVEHLERLVNEQRVDAGKPPVSFEVLPPPPSLFPE